MEGSRPGARIASYIILFGVLLFFFALGAVGGYEPIAGFVVVALIGFVLLYYARPMWFAALCIFVMAFGGLFHLPVTSDGFSSAVAISLPALALDLAGSLVRKDRQLLRVFVNRFELLLPLVFLLAMFISMKNARAFGPAARQIQEFIYIVGIVYFVQLSIRDKRSLYVACIAFLVAGFCVEIIGVMEGITRSPIYVMTGQRSLLGADLADSYLLIEEAGRINGPVGDAAFHGIFVTTVAAVSWYLLFSAKQKLVKAFCVLVFVLAIYNVVGTGSRGAFLSFGQSSSARP